MSTLLIEGGYPLKGRVKIFGAKNSSFKLMIASLLTDSKSDILNVSYLRDVTTLKKIIENLGAGALFLGDHRIVVKANNLNSYKIPTRLGQESRASTMLIPILLHRFGKAIVPLPGGDKIGERPLQRHLNGLEAMGVKITYKGQKLFAEARKLEGMKYRFGKNTHTGTETLILAASVANGITILENAAQEPEVDDLILFLNKAGAKIKRQERTITIEGVKTLHGTKHRCMTDRNEAVTFACMALGTKGDIFVENILPIHLKAFLTKVKEAGGGAEITENGIRFFYKEKLKATWLETSPYPGFMTDWQPLWSTLMTQGKGKSTVIERVFENRFTFVDTLKEMGADIEFFNPKISKPQTYYNFDWSREKAKLKHGIKIKGPTPLQGTSVVITDIRAGATLTFAALMGRGASELSGLEHIERGYEDLEGRLASLGANIKRED